jgi:hypothetical protein
VGRAGVRFTVTYNLLVMAAASAVESLTIINMK